MRRRSFASEGRLPKATAKPPARTRVPAPLTALTNVDKSVHSEADYDKPSQ